MKKGFLRIIALLMTLAIIASVFAGCKREDTPNETDTETTGDVKCSHSVIQAIPAKDPTCTEQGNIAHCSCVSCGQCFTDTTKAKECSLEEVVIPAKGHTEVIDEAVIPTYTSSGLTQGSHCSVCNEVLIEQIVSAPLTKDEYTIQYNCDMVSLDANGTAISIPSDTYRPDEVKVLANPKMDNYQFLGWSNKEGHFFGLEIPKGMSGDLVLYANWASNRNKAEPVSKLGAPIICEDSSSGQIIFVYEIGTIKNIPIFTIQNLQVSNGMITTSSITNQTAINKSNAVEIGKAIANSTTNSSTWTFSKDWNEVISVSEEWAQQQGMTVEQAQQYCQSSSNTYNVSNSMGGSSSIVNSNNSSYKLSANNSHSISGSLESQLHAGYEVDGKFSSSNTSTSGNSQELSGTLNRSLSASLGIPLEFGKLNVGASNGSGVGGNLGWSESESDTVAYEIGASANVDGYVKGGVTGTNSWGKNIEYANSKSQTSTASKTWNSTEGFSASSSVSASESISKAVSELISKKNSQDSSYSTGGEQGEEQAIASSNSAEDKYSSSVVYSTEELQITEREFKSTGNTYGKYRLVQAGMAHVFAVVGYDIKTSSYYTYTYSILDDSYEEYLDYSYDGSFNDYETSILPFEIPIFVNDYVNSRIASSKLQINDNGVVTKYLGSNEDIVLIPSYYTRKNSITGETEVIKVTGIAEGLFKNNTSIKGVSLGNFVNEIPKSAFEGCTSLKEIICPNVLRIRENAFKGCTSLSDFALPNELEYLGNGAFDGVPSIKANAFTIAIANAVANSNAENIILDISNINETDFSTMAFDVGYIKSFKLLGGYKTYSGLSIKSNAENTVISGVNLENTKAIPLEISSPNVTLERVNSKSEGFALVLKAAKTVLSIEGVSEMTSENYGAILAKSIELKALNEEAQSTIETIGKVLVCGTVEGNLGYIDEAVIEIISEAEYNSYLTAKKVTFDANGGIVSESERTITYGGIYGTLPVPTRVGYTFNGWYTEKDAGKLIEAHHTMEEISDHTLYARWSINMYTVNWKQCGNVDIVVTRVSSPYANASIGALSSGDRIYYGDVLSVAYTAVEGYSLNEKGIESITVSDHLTASDIYASASANRYAYEVVYKSSNGTVLGSTTVSYAYGTTNTVSPTSFAGYVTPEAQSVAWDSATKTITFIYTPKTVGTATLKNNQWWWKQTSNGYTFGIKYSVSVKVTARTADSVTIEITWTNTIKDAYYGYAQYFNMTVGGKSTGKQTIANESKWNVSKGEAQNGSATKKVTLTITGITATTTSLDYSVTTSTSDKSGSCPGSFSGTIEIPAY